MVWEDATYHIDNSNPSHTRLKQQSEKSMNLTSVCLSVHEHWPEREEEETQRQLQSLSSYTQTQ